MLFITITIINVLVKMEVSRSNYCFAAQLEKSKLSSNKSRRPRNPFTYIDIKPHKFFFVVSDLSKKIMGFSFEKQDLDLVLVPTGLLIMFVYHLDLLYRYIYRPHTTFMGSENNEKRAWVENIMKARITPFSFILFGQTEFVCLSRFS